MSDEFTFNWHDDRDSFFSWMVTSLISPVAQERDNFEELSAATDKFRNVTLTMQINGISVPVNNFIDGIKHNMEYWATKEAERMLSEAGFDSISDLICNVERELISTVRQRLN